MEIDNSQLYRNLTNLSIEQPNHNLIINGIFSNVDNSLISIATNRGYKIFESYNYNKVSEDDELQDLIGSLKIAIPFYESQLVMFVGLDEYSTFPDTQLVLWDDIKKMKLGLIMLKDKIIDAKISKEAIYILIQNKVLVFNLQTLTYIYTIKDVDHIRSEKLILSVSNNPIVLLNVSSNRSNQLKITKFNLNQNSEIISKVHLVISTPFKSIYKYNISKKGDTTIIVGHPKNKIHIYSLLDFQQKFCFDSEFENMKIIDISISKKSKFFSILFYDNNLEVYNLNSTINPNCNCMAEMIANDFQIGNIINENKQNISIKTKNFFSKTFDKLKGIVFEQNKKSFCKYKFHPNLHKNNNDIYELEEDDNINNHVTLVNFNKVNELVRIYFLLLYYCR